MKGPCDDELEQSIPHKGPLKGIFIVDQHNSSNHYAQYVYIHEGYTDSVKEKMIGIGSVYIS